MTTEFKMIPLDQIKPDPNQPRRIFDEGPLKELTESIVQHGVLQAILVRPNETGFYLVAGERRYRASKAAGLAEIPAMIKTLTQEEAFETQITENLQRKDIHPMEEAVSFKMLMEKNPAITEKDLALRFAKSELYITQRLSFNKLIAAFQQDFYQNKFTIGHALLFSRLPHDIQKEISKENKKEYGSVDQVAEYIERNVQCSLKEAAFKKDDATLVPKAGACTTCPKRSGGQNLLFHDVKEKDRCFDRACYALKSETFFMNTVNEIIETKPETIFLAERYGRNSELSEPVQKLLTDHNIKPLDDNQYNTYRYDNSYEPLKGFMLNGWEKGKFKTVYIKGAKKPKTIGKDGEDKRPPKEIIIGIQQREKRAKELDESKIWEALRGNFKPEANLPNLEGNLSKVEMEATAHIIFNQIGYHHRDEFRKIFKIRESGMDIKADSFANIDQASLNQMIRFFFLAMLPPGPINGKFGRESLACIKIAEEYFPSVLKDITDNQNAIAEKRADRVKKRIQDVSGTTKEKAKPKAKAQKPAKKKQPATKKKSAKKKAKV